MVVIGGRRLGAVLALGLLVGLAGCGTMPTGMAFMPDTSGAAMPQSPTAWCLRSPEPSRCRARSAAEHPMCLAAGPAHYDACRFAMDQTVSH